MQPTPSNVLDEESVQKSLETVDEAHNKSTESLAVASISAPANGSAITDIFVDLLSMPPGEPTTRPIRWSSLPEPESLSAPFAWGDEPLSDAYYMDSPTKDLTGLDATAPSSMYTSWAAVEVPDWGPINMGSVGDSNGADGAISLVHQTDQAKHVGGQPGAKAKGNRKEAGQRKAIAAPQTGNEHNSTNEAGLSTSGTSTTSHPPAKSTKLEPSPLSQGVPDEQIPDWLLGKGEDSYAVLGLSRPVTPESLSVPNLPPPKPGLNRPRLSQTPRKSIPVLKPPPSDRPPATSVASRPATQPVRGPGWKIISSEAPATSAPSKSIGQPTKKKYSSKRKQVGKSSK
ncbi:hypothetical protein FRC06_008892 [Ceratobasidium sp. 370]|nr:hypothetical protein FRC06_008892 [Ceratobasidium sp. 370]